MAAKRLRHGYTTGACAAAAAKGAARVLFGAPKAEVSLSLPWKDAKAAPVAFALVDVHGGPDWASAGVVKDGGDDPDATDGMEIRAAVTLLPDEAPPAPGEPARILLEGGFGVGKVTKPGLAVAVGEAAINPVPREMIAAAVREGIAEAKGSQQVTLRVVIGSPQGEEVARKTLNARLGIVGGISILGTTGIVIPMSASAWTATIDACLDVAKAQGATRALLAFGRTSERAGQAHYPELAPHAAVLMGDYAAYALEAAAVRGLDVVLAGQFAKFCKVAAGALCTHVRSGVLGVGKVAELLERAGFSKEEAATAAEANTAREIFHQLAEKGDRGAFAHLTREVAETAASWVDRRVAVEAALFDYGGHFLASFAVPPKRGEK